MKRKPKGKNTAPWPWTQLELPELPTFAPFPLNLVDLKLDLPDLAPLELGKIPELQDINLDGIEPVSLELLEITLRSIPEPDLDNLELEGLDAGPGEPRKGGSKQGRPRKANTSDK